MKREGGNQEGKEKKEEKRRKNLQKEEGDVLLVAQLNELGTLITGINKQNTIVSQNTNGNSVDVCKSTHLLLEKYMNKE